MLGSVGAGREAAALLQSLGICTVKAALFAVKEGLLDEDLLRAHHVLAVPARMLLRELEKVRGW